MSAGDSGYLREAIALALQGVHDGAGGPFGAVVVREGRVLGRGSNRVIVSGDPTAHAEIVAIRAACAAASGFALPGAVMYASCEPCPMCLGAIWWARIERVVYAGTREDAAAAGFDDAALWQEVTRPAEWRRLKMVGMLREEAAGAFEAWKARGERVAY